MKDYLKDFNWKRLRFIRKLDIITDIYNDPVEIFTKSTSLLGKYLPFQYCILKMKNICGKDQEFFSDDIAKNLFNDLPQGSGKKNDIIISGLHAYIRPLKLKDIADSEKHKYVFGNFIFFFDHRLGFNERLILRDFIDFINDSLFLLGKLDHMKNMFSKYIPGSLVEKIEDIKDINNLLKGSREEIAVLFADVRGFTSYSEKNPPEKVIGFLNKLFRIIISEVFAEKGMVDKFIGDAAMAIFGAPVKYDEPFKNAINCALNIQDSLKELLRSYPELGVGIGINFGSAITGNIGSIERLEYTAIGDVINTASRLEGVARKGEILIPEKLAELAERYFIVENIGSHSLKGKSNPVFIYNVKKRK